MILWPLSVRIPVARLALGAALLLPLGGCKRVETHPDIQPVALPAATADGGAKPIVIEVDYNKLKSREELLMERREGLGKRREELVSRYREVSAKRAALNPKDEEAKEALGKEEQALWDTEQDIWKEEQEVEGEWKKLAENRNQFLVEVMRDELGRARERVSDPQERAALRERAVAVRERGLSDREKDLARREKELAEREAALARREASFAKRESTTVSVAPVYLSPAPAPQGAKYTKGQVERALGAALQEVQRRSLLVSDLPGGSKTLREIRKAMKEGDFLKAKLLCDQLQAMASSVNVDRAFVQSKFARLNALVSKKSLSEAARNRAQPLLRTITERFADGKYQEANRLLNELTQVVESRP